MSFEKAAAARGTVKREEGGWPGGVMDRYEGRAATLGHGRDASCWAPAAMENAEVARRSTVVRSLELRAVIFFLENGDIRLRLRASGREALTIGMLGRPANVRVRTIGPSR